MEHQAQGKTPTFQSKTKLKDLTLIICQDARSADLTDDKIKEVFSSPYKFVSREGFEKAFSEASPTDAFVRLSWIGGGSFTSMVFTMPGPDFIHLGRPRSDFETPYITQKDFKAFSK
jgi:hypothetical protein